MSRRAKMSDRIEMQHLFLQNWCKLVLYGAEQGFVLTPGELLRTPEQQAIYFKNGRSKTMNSPHLDKRAGDLNIFINGVLATHKEIAPLGQYWESLHPNNRWGGNFPPGANGRRFVDGPHFEMRLTPR